MRVFEREGGDLGLPVLGIEELPAPHDPQTADDPVHCVGDARVARRRRLGRLRPSQRANRRVACQVWAEEDLGDHEIKGLLRKGEMWMVGTGGRALASRRRGSQRGARPAHRWPHRLGASEQMPRTRQGHTQRRVRQGLGLWEATRLAPAKPLNTRARGGWVWWCLCAHARHASHARAHAPATRRRRRATSRWRG